MPKRHRPTRAPRNATPIELPHPTPAATATLDDALDRIENRRSLVRHGVLYLHPDEHDEALAAVAEHLRWLDRDDRSNGYRHLQLRQIRKTIEAATRQRRRKAS